MKNSLGRALAAGLLCALLVPRAVPVRAADDVIVFGAAVELTGRDAREGRLEQEGYDLWKDYLNAHGGLRVGTKRYRVEIKYYDDETSPETAARLVERLVDQDHVNFILGPYGSASTFTTAVIAERKKIPMVEGNGPAEKTFNQGFKYTFGILSPSARYLQGVLEMALAQKPRPRTAAIIGVNDAFALEAMAGATEFAGAHGLKIVYTSKYPLGATDVSSTVSAVKAANPDLILNAGRLQEALMVHKGLKEQNVPAKLYAYTVAPGIPDFRRALGKDADYVFGGAQWTAAVKYEGAPGFYHTSRDYVAAFTKRYGRPPSYQNAESTAACLAFQYALQAAGSIEPEKVRNALAALDVVTFFGILKFDARGLNVYKPMAVEQIQNGELRTVWPRGLAEAAPLYPAPGWNQR